MTYRRWFTLPFLLAAAAATPVTGVAQQPDGTTLTLIAGVTHFDMSGVGYAPALALRAAHPIRGRWLLGEVNLGYLRTNEEFTVRPTHIVHGDAHLQIVAPRWRVTPYTGLGLTVVTFLTNAEGRPRTSMGPSGALGLRGWINQRTAIAVELRLRAWDPHENDSGFGSSAAEYVVGLSRSI